MRQSILMQKGLAETGIRQREPGIQAEAALKLRCRVLQAVNAVIILQISTATKIVIVGFGLGGAMFLHAPTIFFGQLDIQLLQHLRDYPVLDGKDICIVRRDYSRVQLAQ